MNKQQSGWLLLVMLLFLSVLAACSGGPETEPEETAEETEQETPPEETEETEETGEDPAETVAGDEEEAAVEEPAFIYPFTGLEAADAEAANRRAVAVMVNNFWKARPQTGLSQADLVFEILAEGNITRLLAIFQSEVPQIVGPVRSAREYYFNLAENYEALYVYHGAAGFIEEMIRNRGIDHLNGSYYDNDGRLFRRADFREAPHNSYLLFENVYEVAAEQGYAVTADYEPLPFLPEEAAVDGTEAVEVSFYYKEEPVRYVYQEEFGKYARFNGDLQTIERETEEPVLLDNVLLIEAAHEIIDDEGRRAIDLQSGGEAYLLQKGKLQKLEWKNVDGRILPYQNGEVVGFVPGKTWVNVIPERTGLDAVTVLPESQ